MGVSRTARRKRQTWPPLRVVVLPTGTAESRAEKVRQARRMVIQTMLEEGLIALPTTLSSDRDGGRVW